MLSNKLTKKIISEILHATAGTENNITEKDISLREEKGVIVVSVFVKFSDDMINVLTSCELIQKLIYFHLTDKTDLKNFKIDVYIKA